MKQTQDQREEAQSSLYLVRRAEALLGTLKFFLNPAGDCIARRLVFLAQHDFWEWEIDNLIYSFTNFEERSEVWTSPMLVNDKLWKLGVRAQPKQLHRFRWHDAPWRSKTTPDKNRRVAPIDLLAETVEAWNKLIDLAEMHFVTPLRKKNERYNIQAAGDLQHLKKKMPVLKTANEQSTENADGL